MKYILMMYITLLPTIVAGIINMIFCKSSILRKMQKPIDGNKNFIDGKRIFGDNKTWKGVFGYIVFNICTSVLWGLLCNFTNLNSYDFFYVYYENTIIFNLLIGLLLGVSYSIFELPNSFLKRRLDIEPGKTTTGLKKVFFIFLDQADSVFGCCLVVAAFYKMSFGFYLLYVLIGAVTHIVFNVLLYCMKLRKNMF